MAKRKSKWQKKQRLSPEAPIKRPNNPLAEGYHIDQSELEEADRCGIAVIDEQTTGIHLGNANHNLIFYFHPKALWQFIDQLTDAANRHAQDEQDLDRENP